MTQWAMAERRWRSFPALRRVLEDKPVSTECVFSTDETLGEEVSRLLHTSRLVQHYRRQISELADAGDRHQVIEDLHHLKQQLEAASHCLRGVAKEIGAIGYSLESGPSENSEGTS